ncbi:MAG TPA: thiolase family protein [Azospirillum sp.]|nr:thiolase family protein [Azospirillum sp.]
MARTRDIAICGYAETKIEFRSGRTAYDLAGEAFAKLLDTTGIDKAEIDGLMVGATLSEAANPFYAVYMTDALGVTPTWLNVGSVGGVSGIGGVARAAAAIRDGLCTTAVVLMADAPSTSWNADYRAYRSEHLDPIGLQGPPGAFGLLMTRYAHQYPLKFEALGKIAVTQRNHALLNENACDKLKKPLTLEDYMQSRMVAEPLRMLDSVMFCDGANAVLVTSTDNARRLGLTRMVHPVAYAEITNFNGAEATPDITETGFGVVGPKALKQADLAASDIRMFHPYDDFTIAVQIQLEQIGFCKRGAGADFILDTDLSHTGTLPLNTGGGQISAGQPGLAGGGLNLVEAVRQMFGEAGARQVADARNAMVTGIGVIPYGRNWATSAVMILET